MSQCGCIDVSDFINPTVATATPVYSNILMTIHYEGSTVSATPDHPFFVVEKNDFVPLEDIQSGMHLKGKDRLYSIDSITRASDAWVMDIAPNEELSYYVGEEPILTSMNNSCDFLLQQALKKAGKDPQNYAKLFEAANTNAEQFHKLLEKLPQGQAGAVFDELANWDADAINSFIAALNKADGTLSGAHISTKIDELDEVILQTWHKIYKAGDDVLPQKRFDFDFLNDCKGKTIAEIKALAKKSTPKVNGLISDLAGTAAQKLNQLLEASGDYLSILNNDKFSDIANSDIVKRVLENYEGIIVDGDRKAEAVRKALVKDLNKAIGESIPLDAGKFNEVVKLLSNSKGAIGEAFALAHRIGIPAGFDEIVHFKFNFSVSKNDKLKALFKNNNLFEADNLVYSISGNKLRLIDVKTGYDVAFSSTDQMTSYAHFMRLLLESKKFNATPEAKELLRLVLEQQPKLATILSKKKIEIDLLYVVLPGGKGADSMDDAVRNIENAIKNEMKNNSPNFDDLIIKTLKGL